MPEFTNLPPQMLSFNSKGKSWRKKHLDWAESKAVLGNDVVRKSVLHKKINYDLLNGKLHMEDLKLLVNPDNINATFIPDSIQHYPIMNNKLNVLRGEELSRVFDWRVIVTNPTAVSEIENRKKEALLSSIQQTVENSQLDEQQYMKEMEKINDYYAYEWQDLLEMRANYLLNHYTKEYNIPIIFNAGFMDALAVGEEMYQIDIVGGEPVIEKLNPCKVRIFKSGYSNRIEDADAIILEDYWSPAKVIDTYYDVLTSKDIKYLDQLPTHGETVVDDMGVVDERMGFVNTHMIGEEFTDNGYYFNPLNLFDEPHTDTSLPYDFAGNVRVLRMYWKSKRKIKKVKSYDPMTGEEIFNFYPETYVIDKNLGEEEQILWINEAWEGVKVGSDIYVNMRPRPIQYNRLSNPSRCHFGIIGTIYNLNDNRPFSLVDAMKPYNYMYDVLYDRLRHLISINAGKLVRLDLAMVPKGWEIDKWMYFARVNGIAVTDSFNEGNYGAAAGKLAGALNNNSTGVIDAEMGNSIQQYMNLLEFTKMEMTDVSGISKQREGNISNRETVGGVERATRQSSYITEWLFSLHDDLKKRALECLLETAKIAYLGRKIKFRHILSDNTIQMFDIDGNEFAEADYGLVVDNSTDTQLLKQQLETLAQAALQNQALSFSTIMKLYSTVSLSEKQRMVENEERKMQEKAAELQQQQLEQQQAELEMKAQSEQMKMQLDDALNNRDNETKIVVAEINSRAEAQRFAIMNHDNEETNDIEREKLMQSMKEFDEKLKLDQKKLELDKQKHDDEIAVKRLVANKKNKQ